MIVAVIAYWFNHKNDKSFADITELGLLLGECKKMITFLLKISIAVTFLRQSAYFILLVLRRGEVKSMILKVIEDR